MPALSTSFNNSGSTPQTNFSSGNNVNPTTPKSKALFNFGSGGISSNSNSLPINNKPIPLPTAPTTQSIKSHTVGADGSVTQTYHPTGENGMAKTSSGLVSGGSTAETPTIQTNPTTPTPTQPTTPTYGGLIGATAGAAQNAVNTGAYNYQNLSGQAQQAYKTAADTNQIIQRSKSDALYNPNYSLDTGIGRAGQIQQNFGQQGANANAVAAGLGTLANSALTSQGQGITGLGTAAGYTQPTTQFGVLTDPTTGLPINGQSAEQAAIQGGRIQGLQSGAQTAAAAPGGVQAEQTQTVEGYKSALQQGQNLQSQLGDLITTFGLNPNDINAANIGIQAIARNTSSPQYKILQNYVNDIANTYAQVLTPPGGSQTDTTRSIATSMLDATASGQSILNVMKSLDAAAQAKIAGVPTIGGQSQTNQTPNIVQTKVGAINTNW